MTARLRDPSDPYAVAVCACAERIRATDRLLCGVLMFAVLGLLTLLA